MRQLSFWNCWPGVQPLWQRGSLLALAWAVAFSVCLNGGLIGSLVWPQWMPTQYSLVLWAAAFAIWFGATWRQRQGAARASNPTDSADRDDSLFIQAQTEYLQGNWEEAEWLLRQRLSREPRDVEARLLLATLYRRRGRRELARDQLNHLARFDESLAWREEIERESERLVPEPAVDANGPSTESAEENANSSSNSTLPVQPRMIIAKPAQRAA